MCVHIDIQVRHKQSRPEVIFCQMLTFNLQIISTVNTVLDLANVYFVLHSYLFDLCAFITEGDFFVVVVCFALLFVSSIDQI